MIFNGDDNPMQKMQLQIIDSVAEFQRAMINESAAEGRAVATAKGVKFGRKPKFDDKQIAEIRKQREAGKPVSKISIDFDTSRPAIYRALGG